MEKQELRGVVGQAREAQRAQLLTDAYVAKLALTSQRGQVIKISAGGPNSCAPPPVAPGLTQVPLPTPPKGGPTLGHEL